jgi:hypothetical protein
LLYIRTPKAQNGLTTRFRNPVYNASAGDKQDIELDESMFAPFIMKVMAYCGVSIKEQML